MGGALTVCSCHTTTCFLEVALFDPVRVARTGRTRGSLSDARYRFERGLDPQSAAWGVEVAARLILEFCGGAASAVTARSEEHTSELQSLMRISYAVFCLKKKNRDCNPNKEHNTRLPTNTLS